MIIVGLGKANHDCSISVAINGEIIKYAKYERDVNVKHKNAPEYWFYKKLYDWKINPDKVDLYVSTDAGTFREDFNIPIFPHEDCLFWKRQRNTKEILLDHHFAHAWSNLSYRDGNQFVIVDGEGSNRNKSTIYNGKEILRNKDVTPGGIYIWLDTAMKLHKGEHGNSSGKIMGLMQYGKRIDSLFNRLINTPVSGYLNFLQWFIHTCYEGKKPDHPEWLNFLKTIDDVCWEMIKNYFKTIDPNLETIYSGGCALNVEWNRRLLKMGYKLNIEPPSYDGGLSIGCARFGHFYLRQEIPNTIKNYPYIQDDETPKNIPTIKTINKVADLLAKGKIVGWYQGNGELGPRALGNRSILMDPRIKNGKQILNDKVKHREWWRPFGASVKEDKAHEYFDIAYSPYMMFTSNVLVKDLHSITHVDGTCRHQTVNQKQNKLFYQLLDCFEKKTGVPILLNTSLNLGGDPIVSTVKLALDVLKKSKMDAICIGDKIYEK
jgi:carbamoyltransferase